MVPLGAVPESAFYCDPRNLSRVAVFRWPL